MVDADSTQLFWKYLNLHCLAMLQPTLSSKRSVIISAYYSERAGSRSFETWIDSATMIAGIWISEKRPEREE